MRGQTSALVLSTFAMMICFAAWAALSPIASTLSKIYNLTSFEKSLLVATPVLLGSILRLPFGILTDRYGGKKVFSLTMLFLLIPSIGAGFANSYSALLFWAFFIGVAGSSFAIAIAYVSKWYPPEKQGLILGLTGMGNFGTALAGFILPTIAARYGIPWVFWGIGLAMFVTLVLFSLFTREMTLSSEQKSVRSALSCLREESTWELSLFYFLTFGGFVSFAVYLPTLLQELFGLTAVDAGSRAAGFVVLATICRPLGGMIADKFGASRVLMAIFGGVFLGATLIAISLQSLPLFTIGCLTTAALVGFGNGAVFKRVPEVAPHNTGAVTGVVGAAGGIGGFFPPIVLGAIYGGTGSYFFGFLFLALFALVCLFLNWRHLTHSSPMPRRKARS